MDSARPDPVLGFYGPDSMMWRINREAVLLGSGPAALLLQIAHPLVAEGVAQHSTFAEDPFKRLHGTIATTMDLVFGDGQRAEKAVRKLNGVHRGVRGEPADEQARELAASYRALDPELLLWVQATLIVTSVEAYSRWVRPLSAEEKEQFWQEARRVGVRLGIALNLSPADWAALMSYWQRMLSAEGPIHATATARRLAPVIVRPPIPFLPGFAIDLLALPGMSLLPARLREEFGLPWSRGREVLAQLIGQTIRLWVVIVPSGLRSMPQARSAFRRARAGTIAPSQEPHKIA
jgi:uncharacterized protein (DUF2236 family)